MNVVFDCIPCTIQSYLRLAKNISIPETQRENILRRLLEFLSEADYRQSPPVLAQHLQRILRDILKTSDPYKSIKESSNRIMLERYQEFKEMVETARDPFDTAMRLAIAGNVIDFGAKHQLNINDMIQQVLISELAIDDSEKLKMDIQSAKTLLYIGDNAGEIVLDKIFLETIGHPDAYFSVRGAPVINDVTTEDALFSGIDNHAKLITTGDDAPGVVWETSSDEFKSIFKTADVIISKGQGNLEGLFDISQNIYFLLVTKCALMSDYIGVPEKSFVVLQRRNSTNHSKEFELKNDSVLDNVRRT
jgi:uncharacterized protein with ATP-grasp and redox domains